MNETNAILLEFYFFTWKNKRFSESLVHEISHLAKSLKGENQKNKGSFNELRNPKINFV